MRIGPALSNGPPVGSEAVVKGGGKAVFRSQSVIDRVDSGICGERDGACQWQVSIGRRAADIAAAVEVHNGAFRCPDEGLQGYRRDAAETAGIAGDSFQGCAPVVEVTGTRGVGDSRPVA